MDSSVIDAIRVAVEASPENVELRLHLAGLLQQAGRYAEGLEQAAVVLSRMPSHIAALNVAADCAEKAGDAARAQGYRQLLDALGWVRTQSMINDATPTPKPSEEAPRQITESADHDEPTETGNGEADFERWSSDRTPVTLSDVAGMEAVKKRLNTAFLAPMRNPELRKMYGKSLKGGLLLYGPPGCGKTFLARAVAGELQARFISIGLTDVVDSFFGNSEKNLHEAFQAARRARPCVLFIDELDALGRKRSLSRNTGGMNLITQLLTELDGVEFDNEGVYMLAATNHPWDVDTAMRRPGRFDRMLLVLPPDLPARQSIVELAMRERPTERIDSRWLADRTDEFSGADVVHLCDSAAEFALEDSIESGTPRAITMNDFKRAMKEIRPSTRGWFETAKNHAIYANESGIYDDLLQFLKQKRMV